MNALDAINACFELVGAVLTWRNVLQLWRDREVKGVYWPATALWAAWGIWNCFFYPSLEQWFSAVAGAFLALGNATWVAMVLIMRRPPRLQGGA